MTPTELLAWLRRRSLGLRCAETPDGLEVRVRGRPTEEDAELIRRHRAELLALLLDESRTRAAKDDVDHSSDDWTPWDVEKEVEAMDTGKCGSCGAAILWCRTAKGKRIPLDAVPRDDGNLVIVDGKAVTLTLVNEQQGHQRYRSHFVSCPHHQNWRR